MFLNKQKIFLLEERIILIDSGLDVGFVDILDDFKEAFVFVVSLDTWIVDVGCCGEVFILRPK